MPSFSSWGASEKPFMPRRTKSAVCFRPLGMRLGDRRRRSSAFPASGPTVMKFFEPFRIHEPSLCFSATVFIVRARRCRTRCSVKPNAPSISPFAGRRGGCRASALSVPNLRRGSQKSELLTLAMTPQLAHAFESLDHERVADVVEPGAAVLFGDGDWPRKPSSAILATVDLRRPAAGLVELRSLRLNLARREIARGLLDELLLLAEIEMHHLDCITRPQRAASKGRIAQFGGSAGGGR